jgi:hypothetical protein
VRVRRALAATAIVLATPATAAAQNVTFERARVDVTIEPNGTIEVTELRRIHTTAPYSAVADVLMHQGELFAGPAVVVGGHAFHAGDSRTAGTFLVSRESKGIRIAWRQPRGTHDATLTYRLALRGISYRDVVDLRLTLWNAAGAPLRRLDATVTLPRRPGGHVYRWLEPAGTATVKTKGKLVNVHARNLPANESLALRIAFPRHVLASTEGTVVRPEAGLLQILAEQRRRPGRSTSSRSIVAALALAAVALAAAAVLYRSRRRNS